MALHGKRHRWFLFTHGAKIMYSSYETFLRLLDSTNSEIIEISRQDERVAIAILLYSSVQADGNIKSEKTPLYRHLLENYLNVSEDELILFEKRVADICDRPDSIQSIIGIVQEMPEAKRRKVLELMKDIALSDKMFHELEVNLLSRTASMLGLENE